MLTRLYRKAKATLRLPLGPDPDESIFRLHDVSASGGEVDPSSLEVLQWAPVWMTGAERLMLYALIYALRPSHYLEIGTFRGGSALIVAAAMDSLESDGKIVCIDPSFQISRENWRRLEHRASHIQGYSPAILPQAVEVAGGSFDFVLIDGDHSYAGVLEDANGVLPLMSDGGYMLFHDSLNNEVTRAIHDFSESHIGHLVDFGTITREVTYQESDLGDPERWGGLRLMQVRRQIAPS